MCQTVEELQSKGWVITSHTRTIPTVGVSLVATWLLLVHSGWLLSMRKVNAVVSHAEVSNDIVVSNDRGGAADTPRGSFEHSLFSSVTAI